MPEKQNNQTSRTRLYTLGGFLLVVLLCYVAVLYNTQIVHGKEYLEQSVRTITQQETVEASRGIITDRNGQVMVSNRQTYNLTFDSSLLNASDDENASILRIIQLLREKGLAWNDNLPVTRTAPYSYTLDSVSSTQKVRFIKFLQDMKLVSSSLSTDDLSAEMLKRAGLGADVLLDRMRTQFALPSDWSDSDARDVLGVLYELSVRKLVNTTAYTMVEDVDSSLIALLNDGKYAGVRVISSSAREYKTTFAAHILGSVGRIFEEEYANLKEKGYSMDDLVGKSGVESAFEDYLRGTDGTLLVSTNSDGKITSELYSVQPKPGDTAELTLDLPLQKSVETSLAATVSKMTAEDGIVRGAGAAVIQVGTGDVLALASYPTYDPATYSTNYAELSKDPGNPLFNRATSGTYAPGSTFKPCTAVAALESSVITPTSTIHATGHWTYPGSPSNYANCWIYPGSHGTINVTQAITVSCNCFFAQLGYWLGLDRLNQYASNFGLGKHTGIEIGDATGTLAEETQGQDLAPWAAFGQANYLFTPLQLANYIATLVDGGKRYDAHLLKAVKAYDNSSVIYAESSDPADSFTISGSTLNAVKQGMHNLTTTGSLSSYFKSCVVEAGAKTGTAQIRKDIKNNGVFVCFAPYDHPQIALAIVIEKGGAGSALASTAVQILNSYFTASQIGTTVIGENQLLS